jgi:predicted nucleic acid-binding protein
VKLFLDTSVVLAACGSKTGASRFVCDRSKENSWALVITPYDLDEVSRNLDRLPPGSDVVFSQLRQTLTVAPDVFTAGRPVVFSPSKDRPILFGALAWADVLLTLDRVDFGNLLDQSFYGLRILRPGVFLEQERAAGRLR